MDMSLLADIALFLGAFGLNIGIYSASSATSDAASESSHYNANTYSGAVEGSSGDDMMTASGNDLAWFLYGGNDDLTASAGDDFASLGAGDDRAAMGDGNDIVEADTGNDSVDGDAGNDLIYGQAGNDVLSGGAGSDGISGGDGADTLSGDNGNDLLYGDAGDDFVSGGAGADQIYGGSGDDRLSSYGTDNSAEASMTAIDGTDELFGGAGNDLLIFGHGDHATGGDGQDSFALDLRWADGNDLAQINDYLAQTDQIELHYTPHFDVTNTEIPPEVTTVLSDDTSFTTIYLDGEAVARVLGSRLVDAGEILLVRAET